jgi:hypothetical protein
MNLLAYFIMIVIGAGLVMTAMIQKKKNEEYTSRSKVLLNIGAGLIVYSLLERLPDFIRVVINFWRHE